MTALYVPILPEHIWKDVPDNKSESWPNVPMVSSGPFHVTEVKNGKYVKMEKNEYYKDGFGLDPAVDQVFFNMYQTQDGVVADYKAGKERISADLKDAGSLEDPKIFWPSAFASD
jgi:peptide/nickel transport system substrate-binding protein